MFLKWSISHAGMSEKIGPQALFRCVPSKACAENHQVPADAKGKSLYLYSV